MYRKYTNIVGGVLNTYLLGIFKANITFYYRIEFGKKTLKITGSLPNHTYNA